jgi:hypothetical protein
MSSQALVANIKEGEKLFAEGNFEVIVFVSSPDAQ